MNLKTIAIASAVGSLLALGSATASAEDAPAKEKCAGIAEPQIFLESKKGIQTKYKNVAPVKMRRHVPQPNFQGLISV